tara:strand:+ start:313 stop:672 length:360 start_codon:yes stop_codon:yes gene_type:complete
MNKEKDNGAEKKRLIQVSFSRPEKFEGDTIYVHFRRLKRHALAEALSLQDFDYGGEKARNGEGNDSMLKKEFYDLSVNHAYNRFISALAMENNAEVDLDVLIGQGLEASDFEKYVLCDP